MGRKAGIEETSRLTGNPVSRLRNWVNQGQVPYIRVGSSKHGKIIFDIELLEERITEMMLENMKEVDEEFGKLRKVK